MRKLKACNGVWATLYIQSRNYIPYMFEHSSKRSEGSSLRASL